MQWKCCSLLLNISSSGSWLFLGIVSTVVLDPESNGCLNSSILIIVFYLFMQEQCQNHFGIHWQIFNLSKHFLFFS